MPGIEKRAFHHGSLGRTCAACEPPLAAVVDRSRGASAIERNRPGAAGRRLQSQNPGQFFAAAKWRKTGNFRESRGLCPKDGAKRSKFVQRTYC
jgi:hypothetical protein